MGNKLRKTFKHKVSKSEQFYTFAAIGEKVLGELEEQDRITTARAVEELSDSAPKVGRMAALDIVTAVGVLFEEEDIG